MKKYKMKEFIIVLIFLFSSILFGEDLTQQLFSKLIPYAPNNKLTYKLLGDLIYSKNVKARFVGYIATLDLLTYAKIKGEREVEESLYSLYKVGKDPLLLKEKLYNFLSIFKNLNFYPLMAGYDEFIDILIRYPELNQIELLKLSRFVQEDKVYSMEARLLLLAYLNKKVTDSKELFLSLYNLGCIGEGCSSLQKILYSNFELIFTQLYNTLNLVNSDPLCKLLSDTINQFFDKIKAIPLYLPPQLEEVMKLIGDVQLPVFPKGEGFPPTPFASSKLIIVTKDMLYLISLPIVRVGPLNRIIKEEIKLLAKIEIPKKFKAFPQIISSMTEIFKEWEMGAQPLLVILSNDVTLLSSSRILYTIKKLSKNDPYIVVMDKEMKYNLLKIQYINSIEESEKVKSLRGVKIKIVYGGYKIGGKNFTGEVMIKRLKSGEYNSEQLKEFLRENLKDEDNIIIEGMPELTASGLNGILWAIMALLNTITSPSITPPFLILP